MLAPQSGADINGQMGMIQDAITKNVNAIVLSTHDEAAAAPLVKTAIDKGIAVVIVNSDIAKFPTLVFERLGVDVDPSRRTDSLPVSTRQVIEIAKALAPGSGSFRRR
jgi:ABC-type sugar transport system substrate-binding protein